MKKLYLFVCSIATFIAASGQTSARVYINGNEPRYTISKHIYGHFSEHLGRCIYDGYWVSDTSTLPKKDRIRLDIVEALKKIKNIMVID